MLSSQVMNATASLSPLQLLFTVSSDNLSLQAEDFDNLDIAEVPFLCS